MPSINRHYVERSKALFDSLLLEVTSDMQKPLLLPFCEHNKCPEQPSLLQKEELLITLFCYLNISALLSLSFCICFENDERKSQRARILLLESSLAEFFISLLELAT